MPREDFSGIPYKIIAIVIVSHQPDSTQFHYFSGMRSFKEKNKKNLCKTTKMWKSSYSCVEIERITWSFI